MNEALRTSASLLLTERQVAELLQISTRTLRRLRNVGKIPQPVSIGRSVRWRVEDVRRWIEQGCPPTEA